MDEREHADVEAAVHELECYFVFFFSSRRRHTRLQGDWSSDVCSSDLTGLTVCVALAALVRKLDRPMTESSMKVHERESEITTRVQEALSGIRAVQAFGDRKSVV